MPNSPPPGHGWGPARRRGQWAGCGGRKGQHAPTATDAGRPHPLARIFSTEHLPRHSCTPPSTFIRRIAENAAHLICVAVEDVKFSSGEDGPLQLSYSVVTSTSSRAAAKPQPRSSCTCCDAATCRTDVHMLQNGLVLYSMNIDEQ